MSYGHHNPAKQNASHNGGEIENPWIASKKIKWAAKGKDKHPTNQGRKFMSSDPVNYALFWFLVGFGLAWALIFHFITINGGH